MPSRIVFINQATGYLTIDIINNFTEKFEKVALITGSIRVQNKQLNPSVKVSKIVRYNRGNTFWKAVSWLYGTMQILFLLKFKYRHFEKFFFTIPPTAYLLALHFNSSFSIAVYDLYPEALKAYHFKESGLFYQWWCKKNEKIFSKAHRIYTLSQNMKAQLLSYSKQADIRIIPNWTAFTGSKPIPKEHNHIRMNDGLINKFVIQYSGNIGITHNVESVIEVAENLRHEPTLVFQIIGRGERSNYIRSLIEEKQLKNCILLPFRKDDELYESLCAADLAVVTLDEKTVDISLPSKLYNIMAAGLPIVAIAPLSSSIAEMITQYDIGLAFNKTNIQGICDFIMDLVHNPGLRKRLSDNSLKASEYFLETNAFRYLQEYFD
jgi:glycosyltransferase involved in cell wall biosynthesis